MRSCAIFFDGSISVNPGGRACYGAFIVDTQKKKHYPAKSLYGVVGTGVGMTVNVAEYNGLLNAIIEAKRLGYDYLDIYGDSQLVVNMVSGKWGKDQPHAKFPTLRELLYKIWEELEPVRFSITWIPRYKNEKADKLSKFPHSEKYKRRQLIAKATVDPEAQARKREEFFKKIHNETN